MPSERSTLNSIYTPLWLCYGLVPIAAGLDKFTHILTDWTQYIPGFAADALPMSSRSFMMIVGVIEVVAGLLVLSKFTRLGASIVSLWLVLVAVSAALAGYLDVAVRDLVMAVGAYALAGLAGARGQAFVPGRAGAAGNRAVAG